MMHNSFFVLAALGRCASLMECLLRITQSCSVKLSAGHVQEIAFQHTLKGMQGCKNCKGVCVLLLGISIAIFPTMRRAIGCIDGAAQAIWEEPPWRDSSKEASRWRVRNLSSPRSLATAH